MARYRVIGQRRVHDTEPGAHFDRDLTDAQEAALLGVHIEHVDIEPDTPSETESEEVNDG